MFLDGQNHPEFNATGGDPNSSIFAQIVEFAKNLPLFSDLNMEAQVKFSFSKKAKKFETIFHLI